jgi:L-lactate dehydrogenase complex protein LldG
MGGDRESILGRVKAALAPIADRAKMPEYDSGLELARKRVDAGNPVAEFTERLKAVNGEVVPDPAALAAMLQARGWTHGYCDPALWPGLQQYFGAGFVVETTFDRSRVDDYQFGITRGVGAIAETGTIILNDATTSSRLGALGPCRRHFPPGAPRRHDAGGIRPGKRPKRRMVHRALQDSGRGGNPDRGRPWPGSSDRHVRRLK